MQGYRDADYSPKGKEKVIDENKPNITPRKLVYCGRGHIQHEHDATKCGRCVFIDVQNAEREKRRQEKEAREAVIAERIAEQHLIDKQEALDNARKRRREITQMSMDRQLLRPDGETSARRRARRFNSKKGDRYRGRNK